MFTRKTLLFKEFTVKSSHLLISRVEMPAIMMADPGRQGPGPGDHQREAEHLRRMQVPSNVSWSVCCIWYFFSICILKHCFRMQVNNVSSTFLILVNFANQLIRVKTNFKSFQKCEWSQNLKASKTGTCWEYFVCNREILELFMAWEKVLNIWEFKDD